MFSEVLCIVSGAVQRVGYRDFVVQAAQNYNLKGYVKNREDGDVEILAQGIPDELKLFIEELHAGSVLARVTSVGAEWRTPKKQYDDFELSF